MPFVADLYSEIKNRFLDFIDEDNTGANVSDLALDYLNRSQKALRMYRKWEELLVTASLTLSGNSATLPADCGELLRVYHDSNSDGAPDWYYFHRDSDTSRGYYITNTFAKATGHTRTITFYSTPSHTPKIDYIQVLTDFVGTGTEYSFFPGELLLCKAKELYLLDAGLVNQPEIKAIKDQLKELLADYIAGHQYVNYPMEAVVLDDVGVPITFETYSFDHGVSGATTSQDNDYDTGAE